MSYYFNDQTFRHALKHFRGAEVVGPKSSQFFKAYSKKELEDLVNMAMMGARVLKSEEKRKQVWMTRLPNPVGWSETPGQVTDHLRICLKNRLVISCYPCYPYIGNRLQ